MIWHRNYVPPTAEEQRRIHAMMALGCVACACLGVPNLQFTECHHICEGNKRLGHLYTIPLCTGHHRGIWSRSQYEWVPVDKQVCITLLPKSGQPSGRRLFVAVYGPERALWERVQDKLCLPRDWPTSKILPRRTA